MITIIKGSACDNE